MLLWLFLAAIAVPVAGLLVWTLLRRQSTPGERSEYEVEVCRAQLREIEREAERGILTAAEVEAARVEIQRRMLAADQAAESGNSDRKASLEAWDRVLPAVLAGLLPVTAFGLYAVLGSPDRIQSPAAGGQAQSAPAGNRAADIQTMLTNLQERLAEQPEDFDGWVTLGQTQMAMGRYSQAVTAFERAAELRDDQPFVNASLGEAMVFAASSRVTDEAKDLFRKALEGDAKEVRSRFYLAIAAEQDGELQEALDGLTGLLADAPPGVEWVQAVQARAVTVAEKLGQDPQEVVPELPAAQLAQATPGAGSGVSEAEADRLAAALEENPKDYEAWIELARMRFALGDIAGAKEALDKGSATYADAPFVQQQFKQVASDLGLGGGATAPVEREVKGPTAEDIQAAEEMAPSDQQEMIRGMVSGLAERLKNEPTDINGWRMLARSYSVLEEYGAAVDAYRRVVAMVPNDASGHLGLAESMIAATATPETPPPPEAVRVLNRVLELDPENADALFHLGEVARRKGDDEGAIGYWEKLLAKLTPGSEEHGWLTDRLSKLKADG